MPSSLCCETVSDVSILGIVIDVVLGGVGAGALSVAALLPLVFPGVVTVGTEFSGADEQLASALHVPIRLAIASNDLTNISWNSILSSSLCNRKSSRDAARAACMSASENLRSSDALAFCEREGSEGDSAVVAPGGAV